MEPQSWQGFFIIVPFCSPCCWKTPISKLWVRMPEYRLIVSTNLKCLRLTLQLPVSDLSRLHFNQCTSMTGYLSVIIFFQLQSAFAIVLSWVHASIFLQVLEFHTGRFAIFQGSRRGERWGSICDQRGDFRYRFMTSSMCGDWLTLLSSAHFLPRSTFFIRHGYSFEFWNLDLNLAFLFHINKLLQGPLTDRLQSTDMKLHWHRR